MATPKEQNQPPLVKEANLGKDGRPVTVIFHPGRIIHGILQPGDVIGIEESGEDPSRPTQPQK